MSRLTYRSTVYRGAYATLFAGTYLLLAAYWLSGDESGSDSVAGIWKLLLGLVVAAVLGALSGPGLHRRLRGGRAAHSSRHRSSKRPHS
ncbi:MAG: hypothetical protein ACOYNZ_18665 [Rhodoferax sp.]